MRKRLSGNQQLLQEEPQLDCIPDRMKPCLSLKSMFVFSSIVLARSSMNTLSPLNSSVVSPRRASLAMSIASEGLQPPGTVNMRTPSPALPCATTISLNFVTALSVRLTILPPDEFRFLLNVFRIVPICSHSCNCFFLRSEFSAYAFFAPRAGTSLRKSSIFPLISSLARLKSFMIIASVPRARIGSLMGQ